MKRKPEVRPKKKDFYDLEEVSSATDMTGLIPTPPQNEAEAESYGSLYSAQDRKPKH